MLILLQQQKCVEAKNPINLNENLNNKENDEKEESKKMKNFEKIDNKQQNNDQCLELSNAIYPVLQLIDKRLLPPKMNISFYTDMFPQQLTSKMLIPRERRKYTKTSEEALYQVKKKLESLHNVLRMYELQKDEKISEKQQEDNNKMNNTCQNVMDTLLSVTTEGNNRNKIKKTKINFNNNSRNNSKEIQQTTSNSSEPYESDETIKSSIVSIQNYSSTLNAYCVNNINDSYCLLTEKFDQKRSPRNYDELEIIPNNQIVYSSSVKYERIPERIYYTLSSDSSDGKEDKKKTAISETLTSFPNVYIKNNQTKSFSFSNQYPIPMETDEDIIMTTASSRTEVSKDSEFEDKSTALLLQEALQFKKALLTRVELEKLCYTNDKKEEINNGSESDHGKYSYINNSLQSKFLDIISEEQSVSSSTEKTSRTYMFFNLKQDKQFNNDILDFTQRNDFNTHKKYLDSKHTLSSPSEYFSFCNITQKENTINSSQLSLPNHTHFQENESIEVIPSTLQIEYLNDTLNESNDKLITFSSCLNTTETNVNEQQICYDCMNKTQNFREHFTHINNINEFITQNINSVELFSEDLDTPSIKKIENSNKNITSNFLNSESLKQYSSVKSIKDIDDTSKLNILNDKEHIEDNEILSCNSNLTLKRNPGACSLFEQTVTHVHTNKILEIDDLLESSDPINDDELSFNESKETSFEMNLIQDSLTSCIHFSNDSNYLEPSVTILVNKSVDEDKLDLDWLNVNNDFSDDEKNIKTYSTNTITLQKYDTTNTDNYKETKTHYIKNDKFEDKKINSTIQNSFENLDKKEVVRDPDFYKSYSNLISPHSSMYFTDEASSSNIKLNTHNSKLYKGYLYSNIYTQNNKENELCCENKHLKHTKNTETFSISTLNEKKKTNFPISTNNDKSFIKISNDRSESKQNLSESNKIYNENDLLSKTYTENKDTLLIKERKISEKENDILNNKNSISYKDIRNYNLISTENVLSNEILSSSKNNNEKLEQYITSSNLSPQQISPKETKENKTMKKINTTVKSRSHENYISNIEKLKKTNLKNLKCLKSDLLNTGRIKTENNKNITYTKLRDLSAEPKRNTENSIKLDKKRSRSQISFRTNELLKEVTLQSHEFPSNKNSINYTKSLETKFKLKGPLKSLTPTPKTSSRSCIPILKSRLEAARKIENESRPKSPTRGPLTMTMSWRDNICNKNQNVTDEVQVEGKTRSNDPPIEGVNYAEKINNSGNHNQDSIKISQNNINENADNNIISQEQMIIYVNIFTKYDDNTTKIVNPNKFLDYMKNRKLNIQQLQENQVNKKHSELHETSTKNEKDTIHKIVTVVSSVIDGNELNETTSTKSSTLKPQKTSLSNILLNSQLKNLCFLSVEQREIDVTAKPSVVDTSTSISDLDNISISKSTLNKFQICGTPKELNNEEYIALLEILHQESNFVHLRELQNICKKLVSEHPKI